MVYLNNASTSYPKPIEVINAVNDFAQASPNDYGRQLNSNKSVNLIQNLRDTLLQFFKALDFYNVILTSGSTESINMFIQGLDLEKSGVVTTMIEHNSVLRPVHELHEKGLIKSFKLASCDEYGFVNPQNIFNLIDNDTKLVIINHCSNVTGTIQEIGEIVDFCNERNIFTLIDASQSAGAIPIDLDNLKCSAMAITGHKSLYGFAGTGALFIKKDLEIQPLKYGGTGALSHSLFQPEILPHKYESGTQNSLGYASLLAGLEWVGNTNPEKIAEHKKKLINILMNKYKNNTKISIYNPQVRNSNSLFTFNIIGMDPSDVSFILDSSFDIKVRAGLHCAALISNMIKAPNGTVRISPSYFSTEDEILYFIQSLDKILLSNNI